MSMQNFWGVKEVHYGIVQVVNLGREALWKLSVLLKYTTRPGLELRPLDPETLHSSWRPAIPYVINFCFDGSINDQHFLFDQHLPHSIHVLGQPVTSIREIFSCSQKIVWIADDIKIGRNTTLYFSLVGLSNWHSSSTRGKPDATPRKLQIR